MPGAESLVQRLAIRLRGSRYWRDVLTQASGNTAAQILGIAAMPLLTRIYAPGDFAALHLFSQAVAMLTIALTFRFEYLVMLARDDGDARAVHRLVVRLGAVFATVWTALLAWAAVAWPWVAEQGALADWLWMAPATALAISISVSLQQRVQRIGDFRRSASAEFVSRCAYVMSGLLGALALPSLVGLMAATVAGAAAKLQWLARGLAHEARPASLRPTRPPRVPAPLRRLAISTSLSSAVSIAASVITMVFIARVYGADALGQYGLVVTTLYLPTTVLGQAIGQVYYQRASALHGDGKPFLPTLLSTSTKLTLIAAPLFSAIAAVSPWAYPALFGSAWTEAGELARWLCLAAAVGFVSTPLDRTSLITDAWWYLSAWHVLRAGSTAGVLAYSAHAELTLHSCIALLSVQGAAIYLIDWLASRHFAASEATRRPQHGVAAHIGGGA